MTPDLVLHLVESPILAGLLIWIVRLLVNIRDNNRNFPPHRHVGTQILYPKDFMPGRVEYLEGAD